MFVRIIFKQVFEGIKTQFFLKEFRPLRSYTLKVFNGVG